MYSRTPLYGHPSTKDSLVCAERKKAQQHYIFYEITLIFKIWTSARGCPYWPAGSIVIISNVKNNVYFSAMVYPFSADDLVI